MKRSMRFRSDSLPDHSPPGLAQVELSLCTPAAGSSGRFRCHPCVAQYSSGAVPGMPWSPGCCCRFSFFGFSGCKLHGTQRLSFQVGILLGKTGQQNANSRKRQHPQRTASEGDQDIATAASPVLLRKAASIPTPRPASATASTSQTVADQHSPPGSPCPDGFSLLPGYTSRPNVSPAKAAPPLSDTHPQPGGFVAAHPQPSKTRPQNSEAASPCHKLAESCSLQPGAAAAAASESEGLAASQLASGRSGSGTAAQQVSAWATASQAAAPNATQAGANADQAAPSPAQATAHADSAQYIAQHNNAAAVGGASKRVPGSLPDDLWEELSREMAAAPILQPEEAAPAADIVHAAAGEASDSAAPRKRARRAPPRRPPKPKFQVQLQMLRALCVHTVIVNNQHQVFCQTILRARQGHA